jgi:hypothetical protein
MTPTRKYGGCTDACKKLENMACLVKNEHVAF